MWIRLALFIAFALPISLIDARTGRIPDALSLPAAGVIALYLAFFENTALIPGIVGASACFIFLGTVRAVTRGLGAGDVKFGLLIGLASGPLLSFIALSFSATAALVIALPLLAFGKIDRKTKLPFGPFLALGTAVSLVMGALNVFPLP